jgi:DNA-binding PadR family transcriptional regulator
MNEASMAKRKATETPDDLLGPIEQLVMKAVRTLGEDDAYGMAVFEAIRTIFPRISFGSVYTTLDRLTWKGYLESHLGTPEATRGGRARKYYRVTGIGKKVHEATLKIQNAEMMVKGLATT